MITEIYNGFIGLYYILCLYQENNEDLNKMIKAIMKHEAKQHNKAWRKFLLK
jgi:hypothetical protein